MPNSPRLSQVVTGKVYNISVVGFPKAGKSCLCNRFALPHPDFYREDHISVLSSADFHSEIVNCENWLYWGCVSRQVEDYTVHFRIIEQTEFINDSTLQPFAANQLHESPQDYLRRCSTLHLSSEHKLRYICKEQLGQEDIYEKEYFPSGGVEVSGFVVVYDANPRLPRGSSKGSRNCVQRPTIQEFLIHLLKLKKPVVLAISKFDTCSPQWIEELSIVLQKCSEFRKVPVIETSSHKNVNVEQTFLALVKLIDKPRAAKFRTLSYSQAIQEETNKIASAYDAFRTLLSHAPSNFLESWDAFMRRYSQQAGVATYVSLVGTKAVQKAFDQFIRERQLVMKQKHLHRISKVLPHFLPNIDPVRNKSLDEIAQYLRDQNEFPLYFQDSARTLDPHGLVKLHENGITGRSKPVDNRIPFTLVMEPQELHASPLQLYVNQMISDERHYLEQARLEAGLQSCAFLGTNTSTSKAEPVAVDTKHILPGQPLADVQHIIKDLHPRDLTDEEISTMYKNFQHDLHVRAREDFLDLLVERTDLFLQAVGAYLCHLRDASSVGELSRDSNTHQAAGACESKTVLSDSSDSSGMSGTTNAGSQSTVPCTACSLDNIHHTLMLGAPPRGIKETLLNWIDSRLADDWRYQAMAFLPSERQTLVTAQFSLLFPSTTVLSCCGYHPLWTTPTRGIMTAPNSTSACIPMLNNESLSHFCSSLPWGGCMDQLFKQLAYQYLPINPRCLEPGLGADSHCVDQACTTSVFAPSTLLPSLSPSSLPIFSELCVAVTCVCSDFLAAQAIVHLLGCAGFSVNPLLSASVNGCGSVQSDTACAQQSTQPLVVRAGWPLSTDKIPPFHFRTAGKEMSSTLQATTHPIQNGQVNATLLSLHKFLNNSLQYDTNKAYGGGSPVDSIPTYHGYIFVLGISSNESVLTSNGPTECVTDNSAVDVNNNLSNVPPENSFSLMTSFSTDDGDDNVVTPRPRSNPLFFTDEIDLQEPLGEDFGSPKNHSVQASPCICCSLFNPRRGQLLSTDCACGICCSCLNANADTNTRVQQTYPNTYDSECSNSTSSHLFKKSYRPRALNARLSAVRSAMNSLPADVPRLLLLAKDSSPRANVDKSNVSATPLIFPAPEELCVHSPSVDSQTVLQEVDENHLNSDANCDKSQLKFLQGDTACLSDWMPAGTNVLDHVIKFLDQCWNYVRPVTKSLDISSRSHTIQPLRRFECTYPPVYSTPQFPYPTGSGNNINFYETPNASTTVCDKSQNTGLLGVASATGRRAMQSANQALKKLSSSSKWYHTSNSQSTSKTCSQPSSLKGTSLSQKTSEMINVLPGRQPPATTRALPTCLSVVPASLRTSPHPSIQKTSPTADSNQNPIHRKAHPSPTESPTNENSTGFTFSEPLGTNTSSDSVTTTVPFIKSGLRASLDRTCAFRRGGRSLYRGMRSRCSVPDCSSLTSAEEYNHLIRSDRNLSTNTLVLGTGSSPKAPNQSPISGKYDAAAKMDTDQRAFGFCCDPTKKQARSSSRLCVAGSPPELSETIVQKSDEITPPRSSAMAIRRTFEVSGDLTKDERPISLSCSSTIGASVSPTQSGDLDSIYEELNFVSACSQAIDKSWSSYAYRYSTAVTPDTDTEDCIYLEPIDALEPTQLERHRRFIGTRDDNIPVANPVSPVCKDHTSKENTMSSAVNWTNFMLERRRRERHRSFSTPEGCTNTLGSDAHQESSSEFINTFDNVPSSSLVRGTQNQLSASQIHSRTQRSCVVPRNATFSSGSSSSGIPTTPGSGSLIGYHSPTQQRPFSAVMVSSATSISSPASGLLTGSGFSERVISTDGANPSHAAFLSSPRALCGAHHHHFFHYSDCPHFHTHRASDPDCASTPTILPTSTSKPVSRSSLDPSVPWDTGVELMESAATLREPTAPKTGTVFRRLKPRPLSRGLASSKRASTPSSLSALHSTACTEPGKPVFVDPKDFPIHQPHPVFYLPTVSQPSNLCSAASTSSTLPKDSRSSKRGKKFNFFPTHRSTASTVSSAAPLTDSMAKSSIAPTDHVAASHCLSSVVPVHNTITSFGVSDSDTLTSQEQTTSQLPTNDANVSFGSAAQPASITRTLRIAAWQANLQSAESPTPPQETPQCSNTSPVPEVTLTFARSPTKINIPVCTSRN